MNVVALKARAYWAPKLVFETVMFVLACVKAVELNLLRHQVNSPRILVILLRDSMVHFGGMLAVVLANFFLWTFAEVRAYHYMNNGMIS